MTEKIISETINTYIHNHTDQQDNILEEISQKVRAMSLNYNMLSGHVQGNLLNILSNMIKPKIALEIGTFVGYSAICIAKGLDLNGRLISIDNNIDHINIAKTFISKTSYNIELICQNAKDFLEQFSEELDFVFIDADKKHNYLYYNLVIDKLRKGGIILIDNVLNKGLVATDHNSSLNRSYKDLNEAISNDQRVFKLILPIRDGLFLIVKK